MVASEQPVILAADIGGTNARFAAFPAAGSLRVPYFERTLSSRASSSFLHVLRQVLPSIVGRVVAASFGVAGPVRNGVCRATNLPWVVSAAELAAELGLAHVGLLNDLEASAWGLDLLTEDDLATLQAGEPDPTGPRALLSAGTGLGVAVSLVAGERRQAFPSEGGHASFAPTDERQVRLWRRLSAAHGGVSWERVLSGPGLVAVYEFVRDEEGVPDAESVGVARGTEGYGPAIVAAAADGRSATADQALLLLSALYGSKAADTALHVLAAGGVYLGGGLAPRLLPWLRRAPFLEAFRAKGRMGPLLASLPVHVVLEPRTALLGAARHAAAAAAA